MDVHDCKVAAVYRNKQTKANALSVRMLVLPWNLEVLFSPTCRFSSSFFSSFPLNSVVSAMNIFVHRFAFAR